MMLKYIKGTSYLFYYACNTHVKSKTIYILYDMYIFDQ